MVLTIFTAAGLSRYLPALPVAYLAFALSAVAVGLFGGLRFIDENIDVPAGRESKAFAQSERMWRAVRSHSDVKDRVANNPLFLTDMTPWPVNISWALLARRRSCYAGQELAPQFSAVSHRRSEEIGTQFVRVFAGAAESGDIAEFATRYRCTIAVVTPGDGAWVRDPFADSPSYRLVDTDPQAWRIYKVVKRR
jgi:hypothetical protein